MIGAINLVTKAGLSAVGDSLIVDCNNEVQEVIFYVRATSGVFDGLVNVEETSDGVYAGTWGLITTIEPVAGGEVPVHWRARFRTVRLRVSEAIAGGTVTFLITGG